jgi:hypothetical protein
MERDNEKPGEPKALIEDWLEVSCFFHPEKAECRNRPEKEPW